jgi:hypothetical protein
LREDAEYPAMKRVGPVWPGAVGLILLIGLASGIAHAEDDQSDQDGDLIYEVLRSFGMTPKRTLEDQLGYHERPPLMAPPSGGLPPPQRSAAARDPNWPADPDSGRQAAKKRTTNRQDFDPDHFTDPLPLSELRGAAAGAANRSAGGDDMTDNMRPSQLGSPGGFFGSLFGAGNSNSAGEEQQVGALANGGLPPPQASGVARNPNWPADPDSGRQAAKKHATNRQDFDPDHFTDPLRLSELRGAAANRSVGDDDITDNMRPSQLGSLGGFFGSLFGAGNSNNARQEQQVGALASERPRMRLVDPPAGYQTPSPSQPYGARFVGQLRELDQAHGPLGRRRAVTVRTFELRLRHPAAGVNGDVLWAVCGRRLHCKRNLTFLRSARVQRGIRPIFAWRGDRPAWRSARASACRRLNPGAARAQSRPQNRTTTGMPSGP